MGWKSILTVWDGRDASRAALEAAAKLARDGEAHLDVFCPGLDRTPTGYYSDAAMAVLDGFHRAAVEEAEARAAEAAKMLEGELFPNTVRKAAIRFGEIPTALGSACWAKDLAVLPKPFEADGDEAPELFVEAALFESSTPVLIVPPAGGAVTPKRVLLAWNGGREAMLAARAALPMLTAAEAVTVAVVDPGRREANEADPGRSIAEWLTRHGAKVEIEVIAGTGPSVASMLNRTANEMGAEAVVMGAYGHSRFREMLLGGATRDMLKETKLPLLMAH